VRILLVDDEEELISTLAERLAMRGIEADCVFSGDEAMGRAREKDYDVIVLDMKMAGLDGVATMGEIRKFRPAARFIVITGHGDEEDYLKGKEAGALFYLMKPIDIEDLIANIRLAVQGKAGS
jgi:two-component system, OmpR family, response regulator